MVRVRKILFRDRQIEEKLDHNPVFKIEIKASPKMKGVRVWKNVTILIARDILKVYKTFPKT